MTKAKLFTGAMIASCALALSTGVVSAATKHSHHKAAPAVTMDSSPPASLECKKGQVLILHTMGKMRWACIKPA
jgi:hypothetical protein